MRLVELRGVDVAYDGQKVLRQVNLEIFADDFIAIVGPNGGGKSTLIKALLGIVDYEGVIEYAPQMRRGAELLIGYMPQINHFDRRFPITIEEVVLSGLFNRRRWRTSYSEAERKQCRELLAQCGIAQCAKRQIGEVSGGQLQRALLCRAIISEPKLLILDEPTNSVDSGFEAQMYEILRSLSGKMAIMMVSHNVEAISSLVRRTVIVNGGVISN